MTTLRKHDTTRSVVAEDKSLDEVRDRRGAFVMLRKAYSPAPPRR
jgi:hypothetical protein